MKYSYVVMLGRDPVACFSHEPTEVELVGFKYDQIVKLVQNAIPKAVKAAAPEVAEDRVYIDRLAAVDSLAANKLLLWLTSDIRYLHGITDPSRLSSWLLGRFAWTEAPGGPLYWNDLYGALLDKEL